MADDISQRGRGPGRPKPRRKPGAPQVRRGTLRLPHEVARRIRLGHPWVYREALEARRVINERPGNPVELVDWDGDFVGRGIYDGETAISVRVMTRDPHDQIGSELVWRRARAAIAMRR